MQYTYKKHLSSKVFINSEERKGKLVISFFFCTYVITITFRQNLINSIPLCTAIFVTQHFRNLKPKKKKRKGEAFCASYTDVCQYRITAGQATWRYLHLLNANFIKPFLRCLNTPSFDDNRAKLLKNCYISPSFCLSIFRQRSILQMTYTFKSVSPLHLL